MTDRRRINGPSGDTAPPVFAKSLSGRAKLERPSRTRPPDQPRRIYLRTGITPPASGSAYLELEPSSQTSSPDSLIPQTSTLKLSCTIHGPKPLPRSAPFSPQLLLSTHVKFAPFASRRRRGYIRDVNERDLGTHLEAALRAVIIGERWPKSGVEVVVTILEGEEDGWWAEAPSDGPEGGTGIGGCGMMTILAGCITVASAAIIDAGIDCVDMVSGGVAALVKEPAVDGSGEDKAVLVVDPCPPEHEQIVAACVVGYLAGRDELAELWVRGDVSSAPEAIVDKSVFAANAARSVLAEAIKEATLSRISLPTESESQEAAIEERPLPTKAKGKAMADVEMSG